MLVLVGARAGRNSGIISFPTSFIYGGGGGNLLLFNCMICVDIEVESL